MRSLGFPETTPPQPVKGGWETLIWRFKTPDGSPHSLRVYWLPEGAEIARREQIAMRACSEAGFPAPIVEATGEAGGYPAAVLTWRPGVPILSIVEKKPWTIWRLTRLFGRAQARLHSIQPPDEFRESAPDAWLSLATDRYADVIEHARSLGLATGHLIHMDYHPLNVVSDGRTVTGVLDWSRAAAGDPRADLARTEITYLWAPIPPGPLAPVFNALRNLMLRAWRSGYRQEAGHLPDYRPLRAWAGATMLAEVEPVLGREGVWGTEEDLTRLRAMIETWAREAGIR